MPPDSVTMRAAVYARYSSDLQRATSIEDQVDVCRQYAAAQGWTVDETHVYSDAGVSGASIDGRPGLQGLLVASARQPRPFDVLLVDDSSRVARDLPDAIRTLQTLKFQGIRVLYISQHIDSANEQAETLVAVHGLVDGLYLREARQKTRRGLAGQHARGFATGGRTFGYRTVAVEDPSGKLDVDGRPALLGKRVEIKPDEAATLVQMFEWYACGIGVDTIVTRLNQQGASGPSGRLWRGNAVRTALRNERYLGRLIWGRQSVTRRPGTRCRVMRTLPREEWHIHERPELRIISDDIWARVQARRVEVREAFKLAPGRTLVAGKNAAVYSRHLFSGFLRCGVCTRAVSIVSGGYGSPRYGCTAAKATGGALCTNTLTIRAKVLEPALLAGLRAELLRPDTLQMVTDTLAAALNRVLDQRPKQRERATAALADAERRLTNLVQAIEGGGVQALFEALRGREADVQRFREDLAELNEPLEQKLAIMPGWVRQQLQDVFTLLSESVERTKAEFRRRGVQFVLHPVQEGDSRPFYRALGSTPVSLLLAGSETTAFTPSALTREHQVHSRTLVLLGFSVRLPSVGPRAGGESRGSSAECLLDELWAFTPARHGLSQRRYNLRANPNAPGPRHATRQLRNCVPDWRGRDGRSLSSARYIAETRRRAETSARDLCGGLRAAGPVPKGG